jgi:integrase/recombinase XerD
MTIRTNKVNITASVKLTGGWRFCKVPTGANHKLKPGFVLVAGQEIEAPDPKPYYLDFLQDGQRKRLAAGKTAVEAQAAADRQTKMLAAQRTAADAGITLPQETAVTGKRSLRTAVDTYLLEVQAHKKPKTFSAYRTALTYFLESCHKHNLEDIVRTDMLHFITYLRKKGQSDRSVANKFENVMTFLKQQKITGLIGKGDWPKFTEEEPECYTQEELYKFFAKCTETETVWFEFFNKTAMREQEVMHVSWSDIDFERSIVTVRENKRFGFKPKAYKGRVIPIDKDLLGLLKTWKEKSDQTCGLIFPTTGCKPKQDFLDECKAIAKRAGLTDFYLHKFRATRATLWLQAGIDIKSVQQMLGHTDLESTMRYLGAQRVDLLQAQIEKMNAMGV